MTPEAPVTTRSLGERLLDPACYRHPVKRIRLVETHISWVLLTGPYAYKVKKPLRLPFLDFSSAAARQRFCEEELRVNRRLAPDLYLDVVPIGGDPEHPRVGDPRGTFEHAVRMVEFDEAQRLDRVLARGDLGAARIREAGALLARFHERAEPATAGGPFATRARISTESLDNLDALETSPGADRVRLQSLRGWTEAHLERLGPIFDARRRRGRVRECHGDLHLENLALWDDRVLAFDAIEFDEQLRWIDVMSDVAFTMMDLMHRDRPDLAFAFLDAYLETGGDFDGLAVLRYYIVYRALVRAKIAAINAAAASAKGCEGDASRTRRDELVALAAHTALEQPPPLLVATHGVSGSGKSHLARELLAPLGAIRVRSDVERARLFEPGPARYAAGSTVAVYERLAAIASGALAAGWPVVVDATCLERRWRRSLEDAAAASGAGFALLSCQAAPDILAARIEARGAQGDDASEATSGVLERQLESLTPLDTVERASCVEVDTAAAAAPEIIAARLRERARKGPQGR